MAQKKREKIGRNDECPCQSGKKYKYCHGDLKNIPIPHLDVNKNNVERQKALEIQKKLQQGHGKSIVATEYKEDRVVAVANQIYRGKWLLFMISYVITSKAAWEKSGAMEN